MDWKRSIAGGLLLALAAGALAVVGVNRFYGAEGGQVIVNLNRAEMEDYAFIDESDIREIVEGMVAPPETPEAARSSLSAIDLRALETELKRMAYVRQAEVSRDLKGNLIVDIEQERPLARIVPTQGEGAYLSAERTLLPLSERYTARVALLTGPGADSLMIPEFREKKAVQALFGLAERLDADPFWKAQIAQIDLDKDFNATMYPLVGEYVIGFGSPIGYASKLEKLATFYDEVAPAKGWEAYERIDVSYEGQIVGKRR